MTEFTATGVDRTTTLKVSGLTCGHCVTHVTEELEAVAGVKNVSVLLNRAGSPLSRSSPTPCCPTPPWLRPLTRPGTTPSTRSSATRPPSEAPVHLLRPPAHVGQGRR